MEHQVLRPHDPDYPERLASRLGSEAPDLSWHGPLQLLKRFTLAVAASDSIPAQAIFAAHQLLFTIRDFGINYIGGWHSVIETEIFRIALDRRSDPLGIRSLTLFSARGLGRESWNSALADRFGPKGPFTGFPEKEEYFRRAQEGELLALSVAEPNAVRMTPSAIMARNVAACALADAVFIPFADKGAKTYSLCKRVMALGVPLFTAECEENAPVTHLGIPALSRSTVGAFIENLGANRDAAPVFQTPPPVSVASTEPKKVTIKQSDPDQYSLFPKK